MFKNIVLPEEKWRPTRRHVLVASFGLPVALISSLPSSTGACVRNLPEPYRDNHNRVQTVQPNGLQVTILSDPHGKRVHGSFTMRTGTRDLATGVRADLHMLEHAWFLSTTGRATGEVDSLLENLGATVNAFTSRDAVTVTFSTPVATWRDVCILVAERITRPALLSEELDGEQVPFATELQLLEEDTVKRLQHTLYVAALGPAGASPVGEAERLRSPDPAALKRLQADVVVPRKISVCLSGPFEAAEAKSVVFACFDDTKALVAVRSTTHPAPAPATTSLAVSEILVATGVYLPSGIGLDANDWIATHTVDLVLCQGLKNAITDLLTGRSLGKSPPKRSILSVTAQAQALRGVSGILLILHHLSEDDDIPESMIALLKHVRTQCEDASVWDALVTTTRRLWVEDTSLPQQRVARQAYWDGMDMPQGPDLVLATLGTLSQSDGLSGLDRLVTRYALRKTV